MAPKAVRLTGSSPYDEWKAGDVGLVHGYVRGGDDRPYAVVIVGKSFVMVPLNQLELAE